MKTKIRFGYSVTKKCFAVFILSHLLIQTTLKQISNFLKDFDDWDDVGLNIPQPPNLVRLYRDYDKHAMPMAASTLAKTEEENAKLVSYNVLR